MEVAESSSRRSPEGERKKRRKEHKDKKEKKEKKSHKRHKSHKRSRRDSSSEDEGSQRGVESRSERSPELEELPSMTEEVAEAKEPESQASDDNAAAGKLSKKAFFAQLLAKEGSKGSKSVGTVHSLGKKDAEATVQQGNSGDWECQKCGTSNFKHSIECHKCRAIKRLSTWR